MRALNVGWIIQERRRQSELLNPHIEPDDVTVLQRIVLLRWLAAYDTQLNV